MARYITVYPPAHSDTYVKATRKYDTDYWPYFATDPASSLTGAYTGVSWLTDSGYVTQMRFHIDLGATKIVSRIYYENQHYTGDASTLTQTGVKNFTFWGSNTAAAFAELTYATDTNWTQITTLQTSFAQHAAADTVDPKYILVNNVTAYRYYAFKFADNWGHAAYMGVRRLSLQIAYKVPSIITIG